MSAIVMQSYIRFECDNCDAVSVYGFGRLSEAFAEAFKDGWRAAWTDKDDKGLHYCRKCYSPTLYDELEGRVDTLDMDALDRDAEIERLEVKVHERDRLVTELSKIVERERRKK